MPFYKVICPGIFEDSVHARDAADAIEMARTIGHDVSELEVWQRDQLIAVIRGAATPTRAL